MGEGLGYGEWGLSKGKEQERSRVVLFGWWVGPMFKTHRAGKGPGGCGGWGLGSRNRRVPDVPLHPSSQRTGDITWEPSSLSGLKRVGQMPSYPLLLLQYGVWEGPSHLPLLISLASLLCLQGPMQPGGGFGR